MNALATVKNIYLKPREAFEKEFLDSTYMESLLWFLGVGVLGWLFVYPYTMARNPQLQNTWVGQHLRWFGMGMTLFSIGFAWLNAAIIRSLVRDENAELDLRSFVAGEFWISVALFVPSLLISAIPYRWASWILIPWQFWLQALCVHAISGLNEKSSVWIILKTWLIITGVFFVVFLVVGIGIALKFFRHH
jgi:hypothetical protein